MGMEIEIRAFVRSFERIRKKIKELGGNKIKEIKITDYWFCPEEVESFEGTAMEEAGDFGLRVRETNGSYELNCKVINKKGDHNAFEEFETEVKSGEQTIKILKNIGMKNFCVVKKLREVYELNDFKVNIEDIEDFRPVIEIEKISDKEKGFKEKILKLIDKLGTPRENVIDKSITYLYMKDHSEF